MPSRRGDAEAVDPLIAAVRTVGTSNPVVLIDGRSGAGKTTLANSLIERWPLAGGAQLVGLDMLYPGWDGLDGGVELALERILLPHRRGEAGSWERWDWSQERYTKGSLVDPARGVVIEGSGILRPSTVRLADVCVWMDAPDDVRKKRALARDGETYRPHWERWAEQERRHIERDLPESLATIRITSG